jgi:hypothetical protein
MCLVTALKSNRWESAIRGLFDLEESTLFEAEAFGDQIGGEAFDLDIQVSRRAIVIAAGHLDLTLDSIKVSSQIAEVIACLQVRIGFGQGKQLSDGLPHQVFGACTFLHIRRVQGGRRITGCNDLVKGGAFVRGVSFYGFDQVGDQICASFQLDIDTGPPLSNALTGAHKRVVQRDEQDTSNRNYGNNNQKRIQRVVPIPSGALRVGASGSEPAIGQGSRVKIPFHGLVETGVYSDRVERGIVLGVGGKPDDVVTTRSDDG